MQRDHLGSLNNALVMSQEEQKIREELEIEIERVLEEEIKEGISQLTFQLHKLYQHKKRRTNSESKDATVTKVNITVIKEGKCKIEAYQSKFGGFNAIKLHSPKPEPKNKKAKRCRVLNPVLRNKMNTKEKRNNDSRMHRRVLVWKY
ncbi:uncharacterized protein LOC109832260 [Asparagus officinalis]|uniref:uncharacterized protein LOC109832260 n=1 Tax=Asparagus officinalis TaxID=4686 RepID=UPI00098E29E1|nr:uncharacterized protein LOC109832260 [Asparagus officinalis]